jgi:hypothetical protein
MYTYKVRGIKGVAKLAVLAGCGTRRSIYTVVHKIVSLLLLYHVTGVSTHRDDSTYIE